MKSNKSPRRLLLRKAAAELIAHGYAICRISPNEKRPTYPRWTTRSVDAADFRPGDGIGIVCGPPSGTDGHALVCVDLDEIRAVRLADKFLPPTDMVEGRKGKLRSHRWYLVPLSSIGDEHHSQAAQSAPVMLRKYGHPGPRTLSFRGEGGGELVRIIGTGGQAVVPPSQHTSGERREWSDGRRGAPAVVKFRVLLRAVRKLARKCGWAPKAEAVIAETTDSAVEPDTAVDPFLAYRINRYLDELPASVSGQGGHDACFRAACVLVWGFALSEADAIKFLRRFNARCRPKWSEQELLHKVRDAASATDHTKRRGHLL